MRGVKQHEPPIGVFIPPFVGENERDLESFCGYDGTDKLASLIDVCICFISVGYAIDLQTFLHERASLFGFAFFDFRFHTIVIVFNVE